MATKNLVIVESPAKSKTLQKILGPKFIIRASMGHVRDLPKGKLGVDVEHEFEPTYVSISGKKKVLGELKKAAKECDEIYLATDPDREGEAIGWHVAAALAAKGRHFKRVSFNEITASAVKDAFKSPRELDMDLVDAQQARRILDRLVGYKLSPVLWKKVAKNLSAGRVQSVAVRLVYERELEIEKFKPEEFWVLEAELTTPQGGLLKALLKKQDGQKLTVSNGDQAQTIKEALESSAFAVSKLKVSERLAKLYPPFTTSTMQQESFKRLHMPSEITMRIAQQLYEGIEGPGGSEGLITYMRTDSVHISKEMQDRCKDHIRDTFGKDYVPRRAPVYVSSKGAQEAHEAIRPTNLDRPPDQVKSCLTPDQFRLYDLVWRRFLASQMAPAKLRQTEVTVQAGSFELEAKGVHVLFDGAWKVYADFAAEEAVLPALEQGMGLTLKSLKADQRFTKPPGRYNDASIVKSLEENGIGRPSTYAPILGTIRKRGYVERQKGRYSLTPLGRAVTELLLEHFPRIMEVAFTAKMEDELDKVEEGQMKGLDLLRPFHETFAKELEQANERIKSVKKVVEETSLECEKCGSKFLIRKSFQGEFLACSGFPKCRNTKSFTRNADGSLQIVVPEQTDQVCDKCQSPMVIKKGRYGPFLACSGYPKCTNTRPLKEDTYPCPMEGCEGKVVSRRSKAGKRFFGCDAYPSCRFVLWNKPASVRCPECGFGLMQTVTVGGEEMLRCPKKECSHECAAPQEAKADEGGEA